MNSSEPKIASTISIVRCVACMLVIATACVSVMSAEPPVTKRATDPEQMEDWWADLAKGNVAGCRALLAFSVRPDEAVDLLRIRLKPLEISSGDVKALLMKLGSANQQVWRSAVDELEYFDPRLAIKLEDLRDRITESPARQRMIEILYGEEPGRSFDDDFQWRLGNWFEVVKRDVSHIGSELGVRKPTWMRSDRCILLLEHIATAEAAAIVNEMTTGHADAHPTKLAMEALAKIAGKQYEVP
jgi:hypothetical protein